VQDFKQCLAGRGKEDSAILRGKEDSPILRGKEDNAILKTERETSFGLLQKMLKEDCNLR